MNSVRVNAKEKDYRHFHLLQNNEISLNWESQARPTQDGNRIPVNKNNNRGFTRLNITKKHYSYISVDYAIIRSKDKCSEIRGIIVVIKS
jgi:hypothetical protein